MKWLVCVAVAFTVGQVRADNHSSTANVAGCESHLRGETLISLIRRLEEVGRGLSPIQLRTILKQVMSPVDDKLFLKSIGHIDPLIARVLMGHLGQIQDRPAVESWIEDHLKSLEARRALRTDIETVTEGTVRKMKFVFIHGGDFSIPGFYLGPAKQEWEIHLPYDLEVMDTPVTQAMWSVFMGGAPASKRANVAESEMIELSLGGRSEEMAPNHPVSKVSAISMMEFANRLSIKKGLRPVYVIDSPDSDLMRRGTANGFVGFADHSLEMAEGYRLPSELEWVILALASFEDIRGLSEEEQNDQFLRRGWFKENSAGFLREVGIKAPCSVAGEKLFDLFGLVREATHFNPFFSRGSATQSVYGEVEPALMVDLDFGYVQLRSVSALDLVRSEAYPRADLARTPHLVSETKAGLGFRLVRTLPASSAQWRPSK